ncbi:mitogen-activated protein kinase kinase kinase 17-like [Momordica charantia]|uniref:Mitogen-activated protein kinase kinase kinase 17-like n=1 Tax=Momordica charantia TaxID=3673 RepID=A0A6J1CN11_MOMCH|nr:mitogen-activated protein kinase kinase kinase 17-like [Momordica charantia]
MSEEGRDFLRRCLIRHPEERWSVGELLKHPFVREQKSCSKQNSRTPTSILEQGFWDTINDSETLQTPTRPKIYRTPLQRIQQLSEVCKIQSFGIPNWESECDENWETVRSREKSDCVNGSELPCSSESMAMATEIGIGNWNYVSISISRSSNCSNKISKAKKRDLPMTSVCNVTLKTIDFSYDEKLCIVISLFLVFAPCIDIELFDLYKNIDENFNIENV